MLDMTTVDAKYVEWIAAHYGDHLRALASCVSASVAMKAAFPELEIVKGWCNGHEHAWCVTPTGTIVDPTAIQYTDPEGCYGYPDLKYEAWEPGMEVRVGKCMECGSDIYAAVQSLDGVRRTFCDDTCRSDFEEADFVYERLRELLFDD